MNVPSLFNNLPIKGYFGFTQFLAITNEIAMHSPMQIFVWKYAFISLRQISSNAIDNRYGTCMVNFLKTAKQSPRVAVTYYLKCLLSNKMYETYTERGKNGLNTEKKKNQNV